MLSVAADIELLKQRAQKLRLNIRLLPMSCSTVVPVHQPGTLRVLACSDGYAVEIGKLNVANARYVLNLLDAAAQGCLTGEFDAMVTAPVQKSVHQRCGRAVLGHTEYLAERTGGSHPVMMLATEHLRVCAGHHASATRPK